VRYLQISLRGTILLVLLISAGLGWLVRGARIQQEAVTAIKKASGVAFYNIGPDGNSWCPAWIVNLIGLDFLGHVTSVGLDGQAFDSALEYVGRLVRLERLSVSSSPITDVGLRHLRGLSGLRELHLHGTRISDCGLAHLEPLTRLEFLSLVDTNVSDAGLVRLSGMTQLKQLLIPSGVSDHGVKELQRAIPALVTYRGLPYHCK
jgi:hypothetical protein